MSNPEEANSCLLDTQETYYEGANESQFKVSETQNTSLNESQDFRLVDSEGDESIAQEIKQTHDGETNPQKLVEQLDSQQISEVPRSKVDNMIITNDKEDKTIKEKKEKVIENETIGKTEGNVSDELRETEKKDELFDEDEIIQGTPPQSYSPPRKVASVDVTSLKRKARTIEEPPAKIARTTSLEDISNAKKQLEEEESHQSCESDDSYQDMFKNIDRNVIIEETQDPTNLEFTQNSLKIQAEHVTEMTDDKTRELHTDHINQQQDEVFSEKCCNMEEDENLNVSAKLTDISANDSTIVIVNSTNENNSQLEDNNLSVETKEDVTSTNIVIAEEKSGIGTLDETEFVKDKGKVLDENNQLEQSNRIKPAEKTVDNNDEEISSSQTKSRISVELIYEGTNQAVDESRSKLQVVQIDDDGEKIVLDSSAEMIYAGQNKHKNIRTRPEVVQIDDSHEDGEKIILDSLGTNCEIQTMDKSNYESKSSTSTDFSYKSVESMKESSLDSKLTAEKKLVNGSTESKKSDTDVTLSLDSDTFSGYDEQILPITMNAHNIKKIDSAKSNSFISKDVDNIELISISDNETSNVEEKNKSDLIYNSKTVQVEREIGVYLKLKCLMHVDESTKEPVNKELTAVQCEPVIIESMSRQKNEDSQSELADISDNKDSSPGSVNSNAQLYQLNPSRLSIMSSISSSSSSSAASLAMKLALKSGAHFFSVPMGLAKHAKKSSQDVLSTDKQTLNETYDRLTRDWENHRLLTTTVLNYVNTELGNITTTTAVTATRMVDTLVNVSNERLDDHLEKENMRSSTPSDKSMTSLIELTATPKSTKKGKAVKRPKSKLARSNAQINGENGTNNTPNEPTLHTSATETDTPSNRKKSKTESIEDKLLISNIDVPVNSSRSVLNDELIGKNVFAKWSDNIYYHGTVVDRLKTKYKVNFFDGQSKMLIPEFVIPIPKILREGLSVYATTDHKTDYGSSSIIINVHTSDNDTYYTVETDESKRLHVQVQNIFLSADQAQVLKEEMDSAGKSSLPTTPKAFGQVTLDNMVDGKRRSKRIGTPLFSTPKSRSNAAETTSASKTKAEPSVSGMSAKLKKEKSVLSEIEGMSSDSNVESAQTHEDEYVLRGIQKEIIGTPYEQNVKGPRSRIKSKPRSKKKVEDPHLIATLGPIPTNSNLFKGMSFILSCASLGTLDRYLDAKISVSNTEVEATETDFETENEDDWVDQPFVRDRLHTQISAGGGKIYEKFEQIPKDEYKNTMLISNVPSTTAKNILCLSAGICVCNHKFIIRCCKEEKLVSAAEHALPNGWSLLKNTYIEKFETSGNKPLSEVVVIIPNLAYDGFFAIFWRQVCENAGAVVLITEDSGAMETIDFDSNVVVVSNRKCPSWAIDRAARLQIPVLSTKWVVQCIIEGRLCPQDQHPCYKYNYIPN